MTSWSYNMLEHLVLLRDLTVHGDKRMLYEVEL